MDFGLIELKRIAFRRSSRPSLQSTRDRDKNENANTHKSGSSITRPSPSTSNSRTGALEFRTRSTASLIKSISFETPLGIVRQSSSSTIEPERTPSVKSQESFKREVSLYKMQLMPSLAEDGDSSDEEGNGKTHSRNARKISGKGRASQKSKKEVKRNRFADELEEIDLEKHCYDEVNLEITENGHDIHERRTCERTSGKTNILMRFMNLFTCTRRQDIHPINIDSEMLIRREAGEDNVPLYEINK